MNYQKHNNMSNMPNHEFSDTNIKTPSSDIGELLKIISEKINNIEIIDESLTNEIIDTLNFIRKNHNDKILTWYDEKFHSDLNEFKQNNDIFGKLIKFNEKNSYVLINDDM